MVTRQKNPLTKIVSKSAARLLRRRSFFTATGVLMGLVWLSPSLPAIASSINEAFGGDGEGVANGLIVSIKQDQPEQIELANLNNNQYMAGVVEDKTASLLSLQNDPEDVHVATYGDVEVVVSDLNGPISAGDFIGTSWLNGVGMKANIDAEQELLGVALNSFNPDDAEHEVIEGVQTPNNNSTDARIGKILVRITNQDTGPRLESSQSELVSFAQQLTGESVSFFRAVVAVGILAITLFISTIFLVNAIRNSLISLGRNPLAKDSIFLSLAQISGVAIAIILIGSTIAYGLLVI